MDRAQRGPPPIDFSARATKLRWVPFRSIIRLAMAEQPEGVLHLNTPEPNTFRLTYALGGESTTVEFNQPQVLIGRAAECDLMLPHADVSRRHAVIQRDNDGWLIRDLGSCNGTFVNRRPVTSQRLADGDQITPGPLEMASVTVTFHFAAAPFPQADRLPFDDDLDEANVSLTVNVEDFEQSATGVASPVDPAGPDHVVADEARAHGPPPSAPCNGPQRQPSRTGISVIGLFRQLGDALLSVGDLDDMLDRVVDLALRNLPAERGFICLCDAAAETITPKATRTKGLARGESLAISTSIAREVVRAKQAILVADAPSDGRFAQAESIEMMRIRAAMCAPLYHAGQVKGLIYIDTRRSENPFVASDLELLIALGALTAVALEQGKLRDEVDRERAIRARLARYSSPSVVEQIVTATNALEGKTLTEERVVTVLFADLCGFTSMAEGMKPSEVAHLLNGAFEQLTQAVFLHDGTLDKYMGDAVMAVFGAPLAQADHAERAVRAALLMQQFLDEFNTTQSHGQLLQMRVGINSGTAVAGDLGSPTRKDYTVVGDSVNVASRLESDVAEPGQIVIGPRTYQLVKHVFKCEVLAEVRLKGRHRAMRPYLVQGLSPDTFPTTKGMVSPWPT